MDNDNKNIEYCSNNLLNGIIALRNNVADNKAQELTYNLLSNADWFKLAEDLEDAIAPSIVDYEVVEQQLIHLLNTDSYWLAWANNVTL